MTLRILHVLDHSVPLHSGYAFRTLAILREQHKLGWRTLQLTTPKQGTCPADEETVEGSTFLRTRGAIDAGPIGQMRATALRLREAIARFEPDLIHAHSPVLTVLPALLAARGRGLPVVYEIRATWEDAAVDHGTTTAGSLRYRVSKALETFAVRRAAHLTTICEGLRREIASRGVEAESISVIPNAVDVERFVFHGEPDPAARAGLGLAERPTIGFIGSFYAYEGLDLLLRAMAALVSRAADVQAVLVGGGPEERNLRQLAVDLDLGDRVQFVGRVPHGEVHRYYRAIDLLVYARKRTRLTELVTPLKPLESMAQGNLVLASDVGGHRELIRDGETGSLFPAGDVNALAAAIDSILADGERARAMRERGRVFVARERSWARSVAGYQEAYRRALEAKGRSTEALAGNES